MHLQQLYIALSCSKQIHFHTLWPLGYCVSRYFSLSLFQCWTCLWKGPQMGLGIWQCVDSCLLGKQRPVVIGMHWPHSRCGYWCHHSLWMPAPHSARAAIWCKIGLWRSKASPKFVPKFCFTPYSEFKDVSKTDIFKQWFWEKIILQYKKG